MDYHQAILSLEPKAKVTIFDNDLNRVDWIDESISRPSDEAIIAEAERLYNLYVDNEYQRQREKEYPPKEDLIVALWEKVVEGRDEASIDLETKRQAVKLKHPKP